MPKKTEVNSLKKNLPKLFEEIQGHKCEKCVFCCSNFIVDETFVRRVCMMIVDENWRIRTSSSFFFSLLNPFCTTRHLNMNTIEGQIEERSMIERNVWSIPSPSFEFKLQLLQSYSSGVVMC